nr:hypothetical protein [Tanacetum cinerariifolium]
MVAKRKKRTLIEADRTMLTDSKLPTTFWAEVVNIARYVQNSMLVIKPHNKTPYELFPGRKPALSFMRPFGCPVTILNTIDHLGKFDEKADEGFFIGYSTNSKAFRVFNNALAKSMNYKPVVAWNQSNGSAGTKGCDNAGKPKVETIQTIRGGGKKDAEDLGNDSEVPSTKEQKVNQEKDANVNSTNNNNTVSSIVNAADIKDNVVDENIFYECADDPNMPDLEEIVYSDDDEVIGAEANINNLDTFMPVSPIPTTRVQKDHPLDQIIKELNSTPQTRRMTMDLEEHGLLSSVHQKTNYKDFQNCLVACFLSQSEPKKVWTLVDLPHGKRAIGTKWVYRNKKEERGIVIRNKARLVALAYASYKDFVVYHMDVKSAFLYGKIEEEVYVCQPSGFKDLDFPDRVYKVEKALYDLHQAPRACIETLSTYLLENGCKRGQIDKTLFIKKDQGLQVNQKEYRIFISQDKYVTEILKKFGFSDVKTASTPMETHKPLLKDADSEDIDEHIFHVNPKVSHLHAVKRIFRYLKGESLDKKSTTGDCQFLGCRLILWQCKKHIVVANSTTEADYIAASNCCGQAVHEKRGDNVERTATTATSLDAEHDSGNVIRTQSTEMPNVPIPQGISSGGRSRRQETIGDKPA